MSATGFSPAAEGRQYVPVVVAVVVGTASTVPPTFPAQPLFETLVIAQASLLAIVISVSMMSMQVSTNRFAPQLSQLYRESSFNAIIARFGLSILLDLTLFGLPAVWLNRGLVRPIAVGAVVGVAAWAFVSLLDIEERLLVFLNPEPVLDSLVESVSFERYQSFSANRREEGPVARNPVLEIFQLAQTSLEGNDSYGALRAVDALAEATERLLGGYADLPPDRRDDAEASVHKLFDYWNRVADEVADRGADDVLHAVVDAEFEIGREVISLGRPTAAIGAVDAVYHFCAVTLANNRFEASYHATLSDLLVASLDAGLLDVTRRAVTDLARLSRLVDRRDDDLLVAADERITPHEEFFDSWAYFVDSRQSGLETEECRSLFIHFERQYREMRDEAVADDRLDRFARVASAGFREIGVAAATDDVQWVVSRTTEHLFDLSSRSAGASDVFLIDLERIIEAGGNPGVRDAIARLRNRSTSQRPPAGSADTIEDPIAERLSRTDERGTDRLRPLPPETELDDLSRLLDAAEESVNVATAPSDEE